MTRHTIASLSFSRGSLTCSCGTDVSRADYDPSRPGGGHSYGDGPDDALAGAFAQHRAIVAAERQHPGGHVKPRAWGIAPDGSL